MADNAKDRTFETAELPEYRVEAYVAEVPVPEYGKLRGYSHLFGLLRGLSKL